MKTSTHPCERAGLHVLVPCLSLLAVVGLVGCGDDAAAKPGPPAGPVTTTSSNGASYSPSTTPNPAVAADKPADNTGKNARDDGSTATPLDQGSSAGDIAITKGIRTAVMADKSLSVNAQNVKIITKDGVVTLRGPVANEAERTTIVNLAQKVEAVKVVHNQLEVAP